MLKQPLGEHLCGGLGTLHTLDRPSPVAAMYDAVISIALVPGMWSGVATSVTSKTRGVPRVFPVICWTSNELGSAYTVDGVRTFSCTFSIDPIPV